MSRKIVITLNPSWVLSHRSDSILPIPQIADACQERFGEDMELGRQTPTACILLYHGNLSNPEITETLWGILCDLFDLLDDEEIATIDIEDFSPAVEEADTMPSASRIASSFFFCR